MYVILLSGQSHVGRVRAEPIAGGDRPMSDRHLQSSPGCFATCRTCNVSGPPAGHEHDKSDNCREASTRVEEVAQLGDAHHSWWYPIRDVNIMSTFSVEKIRLLYSKFSNNKNIILTMIMTIKVMTVLPVARVQSTVSA